MLRKNCFKIICVLLVLFAGCSFLFVNNNNQKVSADITDINQTDISSYLMGMYNNPFSNQNTGTVYDEDNNVLKHYNMRDDYVIYTSNQNIYGLCWSYSGNTALSTTLMKHTGEYYDFSEGWISTLLNYMSNDPQYDYIFTNLNNYVIGLDPYYVGGGGIFFVNDYLSSRVGVVLESDFSYDDFQNVCDQNVEEVYNLYKDYANTEIMSNVKPGYFNNYTNSYYSSNATAIKNSLKHHILYSGAVSGSMNWQSSNATANDTTNNVTYKIKDGKKNGYSCGGHAITIIGWDDEIKLNGETGAWIALNSWGDDWGDDGIFYISYNDTDFTAFWGYQYEVDTSDELYFAPKIIDSTGKFYDDYENTNGLKEQKNIFYNNQMEEVSGEKTYGITYQYSTNANENEDFYVNIYHFEKDVTNNFNMAHNKTSNQLAISAKSTALIDGELPTGTYKVVFKYSDLNKTITDEYVSVFYVMDGMEINYLSHLFNYTGGWANYLNSNDSGGAPNNGKDAMFNDYNIYHNNIILSTFNDTGRINISVVFSAYSDISSVNHNMASGLAYTSFYSKYFCSLTVKYDLSKTDTYTFTIKNSIGKSKILNVIVNKITSSDKMVHVEYDTYGAENNINNKYRLIVPNGSFAKIYAPNDKDGYIFKGWYTDKDLTKALSFDSSNNYWKLTKSNITIISNPNLDGTYADSISGEVEDTYRYFYDNVTYVHLYAKWEKPAVPTYKVTINYNNGEDTLTEYYEQNTTIAQPDVSYIGHTLIGWYTTPTFTAGTEWDFSNVVTENISLYAKWEINKYNVYLHYNFDDITDYETITDVEYGTLFGDIVLSLDLSNIKAGYEITGWYTNNDFSESNRILDTSAISSEIHVYAKYEKLKYLVIFDAQNGTTPVTQKYEMGSLIEKPSDPTKEGYEFGGWYKDKNCTEGNEWNFNSQITENIELFAKWSILSYTVTIMGDGEYIESKTLTIEYGSNLNEPTVNTRLGYKFIGWYTTPTFDDSSRWNFATDIVKENISLYPKWELKPLEYLTISSVSSIEAFTNFKITVKFSNELELTSLSLSLYKNDEKATLEPAINKIINAQGIHEYTIEYTNKEIIANKYNYYVLISYTIGEITQQQETERLNVTVSQKKIGINNIEYNGRGEFVWRDYDENPSYEVTLKKVLNTGDEELFTSAKSSAKIINVWNHIVDDGTYYITIKKYIEENEIGTIGSDTFEIVEISFDQIFETDTIYLNRYVDINTPVIEPSEPRLNNYKFMGWYTSPLFEEETKWDFNSNVTQSLILYANWEIDLVVNLKILDKNNESVTNLNFVYDKNIRILNAKANCEVAVSYEYKWYKKSGYGDQLVLEGESLNVSKVADSGTYYFEVVITDIKGYTKTAISDDVTVSIARAKTNINVTGVKKMYVYNGFTQFIEAGAVITRTDEECDFELEYVNEKYVEINGENVYVTNSFLDVPESGTKTICIVAHETENYESAMAVVTIFISKAESKITLSANADFIYTYNGEELVFEPTRHYILNNSQQEVETNVVIKNAGTYRNVVFIAKESQNYKKGESIEFNVEVKKANITIKPINEISIWLLNTNKIEYEVLGNYYKNDNLNIKVDCDVDKNKIGVTKIKISASNPNYNIKILDGEYRVTGTPYYGGLILLIVLVMLIVILRKRRPFSVEFVENGGSIVKPIDTRNKKEVQLIESTKNGYRFDGWYLDEELTKPFRNKVKRGKHTLLYAKWTKVDDYKAYDNEHDQVDQILRELKIRVDEPVEDIKESENYVEEVENIPREKTEEEKMQEVISKAKEQPVLDVTDDELGDLISSVTHTDYKIRKNVEVEVEEIPKTQEEILHELISKAKTVNTNASSEEISELINKITNKNN